MNDDLPEMKAENPFSELVVATLGLNEMYRGMLDGGFEKKEALYIIACVIGGAGKGD